MNTDNDNTNYQIDDFINHSHKHLAVKISDKKLARNQYVVFSPFSIEDRNGEHHHFEAGFISDGGSIPWFLWMFLRYNGKGMAAFLIHDLWCVMANVSGEYYPRAKGDGDFYNNLRSCKINKRISRIASSAVKRYGEVLKAQGKLK